jgi:DNA modification methylase
MIFYEEPRGTVYYGHALTELQALPDNFVDCVMTSPPYWGLRTYKTEPQIWGENHCEHEWGNKIIPPNSKSGKHGGTILTDKYNEAQDSVRFNPSGLGNFCLKCHAWKGELGLEPTIELYISHLVQIFDEVKRVLKKTGTCWVNIDDSYASGKGTCFNPGGGKGSFSSHGDRKDSGVYPLDRGNVSMLKAEGLLPKSLCLIPERFALAMLEHGWILRNDIVWNKPNSMPESVKDRFTTSWEHLFFFTKSQRYYFEQQFDPYTEPLNRWGGDFTKPTDTSCDTEGIFAVQEREGRNRRPSELGRNKRDVWEITTEPTVQWRGIKNFATFPEKLCETPILAGCPAQICKKCARAREPIYNRTPMVIRKTEGYAEASGNRTATAGTMLEPASLELEGYTDCGCNTGFEPGIVLDPFCGSGKALAVAKRLGRKAIGIELNPDYCKLAARELQGIPLAMELV